MPKLMTLSDNNIKKVLYFHDGRGVRVDVLRFHLLSKPNPVELKEIIMKINNHVASVEIREQLYGLIGKPRKPDPTEPATFEMGKWAKKQKKVKEIKETIRKCKIECNGYESKKAMEKDNFYFDNE